MFFALLSLFELLAQKAMAVAMYLRVIAVFAKLPGYILFIDVIINPKTHINHGLADDNRNEQYGEKLFQIDYKTTYKVRTAK